MDKSIFDLTFLQTFKRFTPTFMHMITISRKATCALYTLACVLLLASCNNDKASVKSGTGNSKIEKLKVLPGFTVKHLYSPSAKGQGSWVAMTFDSKGRIIASDQYGALYRLQVSPDVDSVLSVEKLQIGKIDPSLPDSIKSRVQMGYAQGLLYAFNSLYVMVNNHESEEFPKHSGLYRLQDTDGDDQFDQITLLKQLDGNGDARQFRGDRRKAGHAENHGEIPATTRGNGRSGGVSARFLARISSRDAAW